MGNFIAYELLPIILNMSLTASAVILFVLVMRLILRKAPRILSYVLWLVVLFRLLCPVSLTADFSLLRVVDPPLETVIQHTSTVSYVPRDVVHTPNPKVELPVPGMGEAITETLPQGEEQMVADPLEAPMAIATLVWLAGICALAIYSAVSLIRLHRRLVGAVPLEKRVYLADHIDTPFVLGLIRPNIYLPSALPERERDYILLHERHHIRRLDHVVKLLAFLALCIHWFNPLVWLSFTLLGKDMEMSCDEAVMKKLGEHVRSDYSASLLSLATGRRIIAGAPLAFGEGDTRERVKNVLAWKRPRLWAVLAGAAVCAAVIAACAMNPAADPEPGQTGRYADLEDYVQEVMSAETVTYTAMNETRDGPGGQATAPVLDRRVTQLNQEGTVSGLAPEGTLEAWTFHYEVQLDVPEETVFMAGGMYGADGWFDLEGQGGHNIVALRYPDGSCDILYDKPVNDNYDFYGYHLSYEEALYDWYVTEYGLDLPLYVEDWIDRVEVPEGGNLGNFPVHRFDGDGWYLYIPVMAWERAMADDPENQWQWVSGYGTGSFLLVDRFTTSVHDQQTVSRKQGFVSVDESGTVWAHPDGNTRYYLHETPDGGSLRVTTDYDSSRITDYPYIAMEPQVLQLMAESFTVDARIQSTVKPRLTLEEALVLSEKGAALSWADFEPYDYIETGSGLYIRDYPIDADTSVSIGSGGPEEPPMYIHLNMGDAFADMQKDNVAAFVHKQQAARSGAEVLTDQDVDWFNTYLEPIVLDKQGNAIGASAVSCFLTSYYDDVKELDFAEFLRYFPGDGSTVSEAEFQALKDVESWPFDEVESLEQMPVPVHKYPRRLVDLILEEYAGITTADLDTGDVAYLPDYNAYYNYTSDFGPGTFTCTWGVREGERIRLYDEESPNGTSILTLQKVGEHAYHFVSLQHMAEE